jgi:hypothetical protein
MQIIEEYWAGVLQRLHAEVRIIARLIPHMGERGREAETAFARLLGSFVPQRLGVGTGLLFDTNGSYSRQMDIVLFDQSDEPAVLAQTTQLLFPVETVIGVIEVKSRLDRDEIADCGIKGTSIRGLKPARPYADGSPAPMYIVLAYDSHLAKEKVVAQFAAMDADARPDLVCVLDPAMVMGSSAVLGVPDDREFVAGLALLAERDADGRRTGWMTVQPDGSTMLQSVGQLTYRVVEVGTGVWHLAESGRALLMMVESVARCLAARQGREQPALSSYMTAETRALVEVRPAAS